jgi:phage major head subunit gpT-like protein
MALVAQGAMSKTNFGDLLEPGFRKIFFDELSQLPTMYDQIFHVMNSSRQQEYDSGVSGLGQLVEASAADQLTYESLQQLYDKNYVHKIYKKGIKIERELYDDDQYNVIQKGPKMLAQASVRTVENTAGNIFDNAFSSGTGGDGKYLCDTQHPRIDGGTVISNAATATLAETGLANAILAMRKTVDDKGQKVLVQPDTLLVPPDQERTARVLLESQGRTGTNYNEINPIQGRLKLKVWDYLDGSTTQWFVIDSGIHQLNFFWRVRPEFSQDTSFETDVALYKVYCRYSVGFSAWRGIYGSTGTS